MFDPPTLESGQVSGTRGTVNEEAVGEAFVRSRYSLRWARGFRGADEECPEPENSVSRASSELFGAPSSGRTV